jgi:calmodulin
VTIVHEWNDKLYCRGTPGTNAVLLFLDHHPNGFITFTLIDSRYPINHRRIAAHINTRRNKILMEGSSATPEEIAEFREIFNLVDLDGGGSIDSEELRELMDLLGMQASEEEMGAMLQEIDSNGTGEISFEDFVRVMSKKVVPEYTAEQIIRAFQKFAPKDCPPHMITQDALVQVLSSYEGKIPVGQARELVDKIECDAKTKLINYHDYVNMMMAD